MHLVKLLRSDHGLVLHVLNGVARGIEALIGAADGHMRIEISLIDVVVLNCWVRLE